MVLPEEQVARRERAGMAALPAVAIVAGSVDLDWRLPLFTDTPTTSRPIVITTESGAHRLDGGTSIIFHVVVPGTGTDRVDLAAAMPQLQQAGGSTVSCERDPRLLGQLVDAGLLDELCLTLSPAVGGDPLPISVTPDGSTLRCFELVDVLADDQSLSLRYLAT
ncbi:MAG: dihydrofolate reductase family protein [Actinobacteria bacterium]|nr:dihydrofolate reductase family protein [Actinomycetota bacterium]